MSDQEPEAERRAQEPAAPPKDDLLIEARGLRKTFVHGGKSLHVLQCIDLDIRRGETIAILGASGAGKSTLLHILGTLDLPTAGTVRFDKTDLFAKSPRDLAFFRNRSIGFVFQFHHLLPEFNALENVMMPGMIARRPRAEVHDMARRVLTEVGLADRLTHRPAELSGGEQQRVAIARALVMEPRLVLADEPTGNIDSQTAAGIHDLFFQLNDTHGTTMVVVTHDDRLARKMPRRLEIRDGVIEGGTLGP